MRGSDIRPSKRGRLSRDSPSTKASCFSYRDEFTVNFTITSNAAADDGY
jgi:hypothetical protein